MTDDDTTPRERDAMSALIASTQRALEFGRTIERARTRRGWTAEEAAKRAGVAPKTWQRLEDGKPVRNLTFNKVDKLFGLPEGTTFEVWQNNGNLQEQLDKSRRLTGSSQGIAEIIAKLPSASLLDDFDDLDTDNGLNPFPSIHVGQIINGLFNLSIDDLDTVVAAAQATRNAKARELTKVMRLPWPSRNMLSGREQEAIPSSTRQHLEVLSKRYIRAHEDAVKALARSLDPSPGSIPDELYESLRAESEQAEKVAQQAASELMGLIELARKQAQLPLSDVRDDGSDDAQH